MMPPNQGKILPPSPIGEASKKPKNVFSCWTRPGLLLFRMNHDDRRHGGTRAGTARRVLEVLPHGHPGPGIIHGFPIHEASSGMLQQEKQGWSLLRKLHYA